MPVVTPNIKNGPGTGSVQASTGSGHLRNKAGSNQGAFLAGILACLLVLVSTFDSVRSADDTRDVDSTVVVLKIANHTEWMIPRIESLRDTFITRLQKTGRINVLGEIPEQQPVDEMFKIEKGKRLDISKWPAQPAARYIVVVALQSLDAEVKREFNFKLNVALEKPTVNVRMDFRVIDLNPPQKWVIRAKDRRVFQSTSDTPVVQEFFDTFEDTVDPRKDLNAKYPNRDFPRAISIRIQPPGKIVFATGTRASRQETNVTADNFFPEDAGILKNTLVQDAVIVAMDSAIRKMMDELWPLKIIRLDGTDQVYVDRGREAGMKIGDVFIVRELGQVLTDPETGQQRGRARGKMIARIRIVKTEDVNSIAKIEYGESSKDLEGAFCHPAPRLIKRK